MMKQIDGRGDFGEQLEEAGSRLAPTAGDDCGEKALEQGSRATRRPTGGMVRSRRRRRNRQIIHTTSSHEQNSGQRSVQLARDAMRRNSPENAPLRSPTEMARAM